MRGDSLEAVLILCTLFCFVQEQVDNKKKLQEEPCHTHKKMQDGESSSSLVAKPRVALITGITGQDGSYLAELLLSRGYVVHGLVRRSSSFNTSRLDHLYSDRHDAKARLFLHYGDMSDAAGLIALVQRTVPDEVYNLAAQSHVKVSFDMPVFTADVDGLGVLRLLEAIRFSGREKLIRFYQASTSELFGRVRETPQRETTPFNPQSPYAAAKLLAFFAVCNYREAYGMFAVNGILFNHESPRRGPTFVTRKITRAVARIAAGQQREVLLGNLDSKRDWGHARDYVEAMWLMLQAEKPKDYVVATGETHTVREFAELAFRERGIELVWSGSGEAEVGKDRATGQVRVRVDPEYFRPTEVDLLLGDPSLIRSDLGWVARVPLGQLVAEMVAADSLAV